MRRDWHDYDRSGYRSDFRRDDRPNFFRREADGAPRSFPSRERQPFFQSPVSQQYRKPVEGRDRGWWERAGDEVLTWFGDDYAERRRRKDEMHGMHRGKGPKNYVRSDERIREDINDKLTDEWNIDASDIEVVVSNHEVILSGFVSDRFQKRRAADLAENVLGVAHVENRLKVDPYIPKENVNFIP